MDAMYSIIPIVSGADKQMSTEQAVSFDLSLFVYVFVYWLWCNLYTVSK